MNMTIYEIKLQKKKWRCWVCWFVGKDLFLLIIQSLAEHGCLTLKSLS